MKKVIVKCKIGNRERLENKLDAIDLEFSPIYWLHDRTYVPRGYKYGANFPRLTMRTEMHAVDEPPVYTLLLRRHIEDSGIDIVERTPVTNYVEMVNIILQLGFKQAGEVSRRRQDLRVSENVVMCLDEIDGRENEHYAKLESVLAEGVSAIATKTDLIHLFKTLGEQEVIEKSYFEL